MEKLEIFEKVNKLHVGESININTSSSDLKHILSDKELEDKNFETVKVDKNTHVIVRVDTVKSKLNSLVIDKIKELRFDQKTLIDGSYNYVRGIVKKFNEENNREVIVNMIQGDVYISEDFMSRESISVSEWNDFREKMEMRVNGMGERIEGGKNKHEFEFDKLDDDADHVVSEQGAKLDSPIDDVGSQPMENDTDESEASDELLES